MCVPKWITLTCLLALVAPGCGPTDNTIPVSKEEVSKVPTDATPEKSKANKQAITKKAADN